MILLTANRGKELLFLAKLKRLYLLTKILNIIGTTFCSKNPRKKRNNKVNA